MQQVLGVLRQLLRKLDIEGDKDVALLTRLLRQGQPVTWTPAIIIIILLLSLLGFYYARMCIVLVPGIRLTVVGLMTSLARLRGILSPDRVGMSTSTPHRA